MTTEIRLNPHHLDYELVINGEVFPVAYRDIDQAEVARLRLTHDAAPVARTVDTAPERDDLEARP